jgi:hypothetical protein
MLETTKSRPQPKYRWQQGIFDVLTERSRERVPDKLAAAEKVVSERLVEEPPDADENLALRGAVIILEALRHPNL